MVSKKMKTFIVNEKEVQFNTAKFKELFYRYSNKKESLIGEYECEIAELLYVDRSAIHNWRMGLNGPGELEKIHQLEKHWHLQENSLLMEVKAMENAKTAMRPLTGMEREFIMRAYNAYVSFVETFEESLGFRYAIIYEEMMNFELSDEDRTPYDPEDVYKLLSELTNLIEEEGYFILNRYIYEIMLEFLDRARTMAHINPDNMESIEGLYDLFGLDKTEMSCDNLFWQDDHPILITEIERQYFRDKVEPFLAL